MQITPCEGYLPEVAAGQIHCGGKIAKCLLTKSRLKVTTIRVNHQLRLKVSLII
jgi:hypothetical protein